MKGDYEDWTCSYFHLEINKRYCHAALLKCRAREWVKKGTCNVIETIIFFQ